MDSDFMARFERKYVISELDFIIMERRLALLMRRDPYCQHGSYMVRSLYFDTFNDDSVFDVLAGLWSKQKIRLRTYDVENGPFVLEFKCRTGELGIKKKVPLTRDEAEQLVSGRYGVLGDRRSCEATEIYATMMSGCYLPRTIVDYQRIAYIDSCNDTRVTFDTRVSGSYSTRGFFDPNVPLSPLLRPGTGVLEVKYDDFLLSYVKDIISEVVDVGGLQANSKYLQSRLWTT